MLINNVHNMFLECHSLSSITFPSSVTFGSVTDASKMFQGCSSLSSLTFPSSVTFASLTNVLPKMAE